ncbi:MAG: FHA domain-containing protein [Acidobacteria bacterium]|nr:FHA domain-containing protein [Acidobacteriota bacterium]
MSVRECSRCGHGNEREANYCSSCGTLLAPPNAEEKTSQYDVVAHPEPLVASQDKHCYLEVDEGIKRGSRYSLDVDKLSAGRHPDSAIFLDDVTVSRRHAELQRIAGGFEVRDVGSLNGTYLNGTSVDRATLRDGDILQVGKFKLRYVEQAG